MAVDTAPGTVTAPVPARELAALDATGLLGITVPRAYGGPDLPATVLADHHVGNYLLSDVLPPNHGQL